MVAVDDVDPETLQAQVDMTMSFAHNLVTSWIKPSHLAQFRSSGVNAAQIFEDELRRPPRLGVGTSIPKIVPFAQEASKLKRRLRNKEVNNQGAVESLSQDLPESDDEESKGRPAKRKTKVDPFAHEGSKKKRKPNTAHNGHHTVGFDTTKGSLPDESISGEPLPHNSFSRTQQQWIGPADPHPNARSLSEAPREASEVPVPGVTNAECIGAHVNSVLIPDKAKVLGIPLLNLDGVPESTDKPGNTSELNQSFKKKRKRRKKKKTKNTAGMADN